MYQRLGNHFGRTRWISLVTLLMWNLISIHFETVVVVMQVWFTVCAKRTIGSQIVLHAPDILRGDEAQVGACFGLFGDSANLEVR
jgi:hypothetical protein